MGTAILAFLSGIASKVVLAVLGMVAGWFMKVVHQKVQDKQADDTAASDAAPLAKAQTGQEIKDATDSALNHL